MTDDTSEANGRVRAIAGHLGASLRDESLCESTRDEATNVLMTTNRKLLPRHVTMAEMLGFPLGRQPPATPRVHRELAVRAVEHERRARTGEAAPRGPEAAIVSEALGIPWSSQGAKPEVGRDGPWVGPFAHVVSKGASPSRIALASSQFHVSMVKAADVPVALTLHTPDGGTIDLRVYGTRWLRPVLAPDSWAPCKLDDFMAAAADGVAWRDNPFSPGPAHLRCAFDMSTYASASELDPFLTRKATKEAARILDDLGPLRCVDGVVHVETDAPVLDLVHVTTEGGTRLEWTWRCGKLTGLDPQDTLRVSDVGTAMPVSQLFEHQGPQPVDPSLPIWDVETATHVSEAFRSMTATRWRRGREFEMVAPGPGLSSTLVGGCPEGGRERAIRVLRKTTDLTWTVDWKSEGPEGPFLRGPEIGTWCRWALGLILDGSDLTDVGTALRTHLPDAPARTATISQMLCGAFAQAASDAVDAACTLEPEEPEVMNLRL